MNVTVTADGHYGDSIESVMMDGVECEQVYFTNHARSMYLSPCGDFIIKVDDPDYGMDQSVPEHSLWQELDEQDQPFFAETVASGPIVGAEHCGWNVQRYYPDLQEIDHDHPQAAACRSILEELSWKYELTDMSYRQAKITQDGDLILHDYGLSKRHSNDAEHRSLDGGYWG